MLLVIDSGNTRTKWALVDGAGVMQETTVCLNTDLATSQLKQSAQKANQALIANVAGEALAHQITQLIAPLRANFIVAKRQAGDMINHYEQVEKLGADRWASLIAAWHITHQPTVVINAGTAITIDCLSADNDNKGLFLGGTIMPGLFLMKTALTHNAAQLKVCEGRYIDFPLSTQNAIQTGCLNAAIGAIIMMHNQLQHACGLPPKILISGGDAAKIAHALLMHLNVDKNHVMIIENLVLQGLAILQKETI
ncbi:MAG: type III pantothenate kinase [Methylotenera sp.]|nr:MAG: type III pantothenate kinase [Methylotenera sp.]